MLPQEKLHFKKKVISIDASAKKVTMTDGSVYTYNKLMSTIPLDLSLNMITGISAEEQAKYSKLSSDLTYSSSHIIGLGIRGVNPHDLKCWLYYPEDNCPFYRCTVFSHYAKKNCPDDATPLPTLRLAQDPSPVGGDAKTGPYWSLMFEVSESKDFKPVDVTKVVEETIQGAINTGMIAPTDEIVSVYHRRLEHGYPTPSLKRDAVLQEALPLLKEKDIWSRGRFGSYKYEVANQDHSCMIGVECVDNMLLGSKEFTLMYPALTNERGNKNTDVKFTLGI